MWPLWKRPAASRVVSDTSHRWVLSRRVVSQRSVTTSSPCRDVDRTVGRDTRALSARRGTGPTPQKPVYYNFNTLHLFPSAAATSGDATASHASGGGNRRVRRLTTSLTLHSDDSLPLENTAPRDEADPYKDVHIFRRDMVDAHGSKSFSLSVDVPLKKLIDMFSDFEGKRCRLCNETFLQWHSHQNAIPHAGREGLLLEMVRAHCGTPDEILKMWWHRLHTSKAFHRIPSLSHENSHVRKRRLQFLLRFLKDRRIVKDTFNVMQSAAAGAGRTWEFERLEWVGDNVVKYVFNNRLNCVFPVREGGIRGKLGYSQFMIDGNDGLARAYDYLELQQLTQSDRVVSKFKSDVVETLFGELQLYLWSTEVDSGTESFAMPFGKDMHSVRALVAHTMEELGHVMFMYHAEYLHGCLQRVVRENQLQFVKADPAARSHTAESSSHDHARSLYSQNPQAVRNKTKLSPTRVTHSHHGGSGSSLFLESINYDGFKRVVPLGGLLPRPFHVHELAVTPAYMPHLQVVPVLTEKVETCDVATELGAYKDVKKSPAVVEAEEGHRDAYEIRPSPESTRESPPGRKRKRLGIPELKDADLITELL